MAFPPLPRREGNVSWSPQVSHVAQILSDVHRMATNMLTLGNFDIHRLEYHQEAVIKDAFPLLMALEAVEQEEGIPSNWIQEATTSLVNMVEQLSNAENTVVGRCVGSS